MFAPWPTNNGVLAVLLPCLIGSSLASTAMMVWTVNLPFTAVQEPMATLALAPEARVPVNEPVRVVTVLLLLSNSVRVTSCVPPADAIVPWFLTVTVKLTVLPAAGLFGVQLTVEAIRSELWTGVTTRDVGLVKLLLLSFNSMTLFDSSTLAVYW